jgi:hypothetical protein
MFAQRFLATQKAEEKEKGSLLCNNSRGRFVFGDGAENARERFEDFIRPVEMLMEIYE